MRSVGLGECWHKNGTFLDHFIEIYRILKIWKTPDCVCLCDLFHSAYSDSLVNRSIFDRNAGREEVRVHVGEAVEKLIHLFNVIPRLPLIHDHLLFNYSDQELVEHLKLSSMSLENAKERGLFDGDEAWRKKIRALLPENGTVVKHIKTGENVSVSRRVLAVFLMMTIADVSDKIFGFQDCFLIVREEEILIEERKRGGGIGVDKEAVCEGSKTGLEKADELLSSPIEKNPSVGERLVVLGQVYLTKGRFEEAEKGIRLILEWGSPWDKRMSWEVWVSWARVFCLKAKEKAWPQTSN
ncbi:hypothetical protein QYF36_001319 [Acer negundo]|nr:hypothetical protein QYF36_001319 [Acer negundo]